MMKVEGSDQGVNTRFVVTDMEQARTQGLQSRLSGARTMSCVWLRTRMTLRDGYCEAHPGIKDAFSSRFCRLVNNSG